MDKLLEIMEKIRLPSAYHHFAEGYHWSYLFLYI